MAKILIVLTLFCLKVSAAPCPQSLADWANFRLEVALKLQKKPTKTFLKEAMRCFAGNEAIFNQNGQLKKCFAPVRKELERQVLVQNVSQKLTENGIKNFLAQGKIKASVNEKLKDGTFLQALTMGDIETAEKYLEKVNSQRAQSKLKPFEYLRFQANASSTTGDRTDQRFLVYDPGTSSEKTERWLSYTLPETKDSKDPLVQLSVVAVHTEPSEKKKTYYADHHRTSSGSVLAPHDVKPPPSTDSYYCIACHLSGGPLAIHPSTPIEAKYQDTLKSINKKIGEIGLSFSEFFDPLTAQVGMDLDVDSLPNSTLLSCYPDEAKPVTKNSLERLRSSLNCVQCHDGRTRARIQASGDSVAADTLNAWWIHNEAMPPDIEPPLTKEEREVLLTCLRRYQNEKNPKSGLLYQQLVAISCDSSQAAPQEQKVHSTGSKR